MELIFVLVAPAVPENIGAAARAIKTMGGNQLRLVNPKANHLSDPAKWLAHGSQDVLDETIVFERFSDAIADLDYTIATTAKRRSASFDYYTPTQAKSFILNKGTSIKKLGIVFGCEESGLANEDIRLCDMVSYVPLAAPYPSINLAQSVMIYAYEFSEEKASEIHEILTDQSAVPYREVKNQVNHLLQTVGIYESTNLHRRIRERLATASSTDIHLILSFIKNFRKKFE